MTDDLPIFPLNTVLFPGGLLPLRVFEPRYIDMVSACMRSKTRFGVCLIAAASPGGGEVMRRPGDFATPEAVGCEAEIVDWGMQDAGVLRITVRGHARFRIRSQRIEANGLIRAVVDPIAADPPATVPDPHAGCARLLARMIAELEGEREAAAGSGADTRVFPFARPYALDDAGWVANRLCEVLAIPNKAKQKLMELGDGAERLAIVDAFLRQRKVF